MNSRLVLMIFVVAVGLAVGGGSSRATVSGIALSLNATSSTAYVSGTTVYYNKSSSGSFSVTVGATVTSGDTLTVDFPVVFGADSASDSALPSSHSYSWTSGNSAGPTNTVTVTDTTDSTNQTADFGVVADVTGPTGQSAALSGGPTYGTLSVPLVLNNGSDSGSGVDTTSGVVERASATVSGGACGSFGSYATVTLVSGADTSVASGNCYRYRYSISDRVGNSSGASSPSADAIVNTTVPTVANTAPTELTGAGDQHWVQSTNTLWFRPAGSGSFRLNATASDAKTAIAKVDFPDVSATSGWAGSTGGTDTSSPYSSPVTYTWTAGAAAPGAKQVIATNTSALTASASITLSADSTAPAGQSVALAGGPWYGTTSVPLTVVQGTDEGAGVNTGAGIVERASASLKNGACGTYGAFATVTLSAGADTSVSTASCYRYQLKAVDNVGNVSTASTPSADARIDTTPPARPSLFFGGFTNTASSGNVVYYRLGATDQFTVTTASTDGESGVASYAFQSMTGFDTHDSGAGRTVVFSGSQSTPRGPFAVSAVNRSGLASPAASFTVAPDPSPPTIQIRCNGKPCHAGAYPKGIRVTLAADDHAGSGVETIRYTFDGTTPTARHGAAYDGPFVVHAITRLKVRAYDRVGNASRVVNATIRSLADRLVFGAPLALSVKIGSRYLFARVTSSHHAVATATLSGPGLKTPRHWRFVVGSGASIVQFKLPKLTKTGHYRLVWTVQAGSRSATKTTRVVLKPKPKR